MKRFYINFWLFLSIFSSNFIAQSFDEFFSDEAKLGGYGELHYNVSKYDDGSTEKTLDFHRFVLFYSYHWNEQWSFMAEVELEHNLVADDEGELELEQAYVSYKPSKYIGLKAGVLLANVGIINEFHEPPTFLSVERPEYAIRIIPTTWFGNGVSLFGNAIGFDYVLTLMEGLNPDKLKQENILRQGLRSGRQKGFQANAKSGMLNGRINYTGFPGLLIGASLTFNNAVGDSSSNKIMIFEGHLKYAANNVILTAEFGRISYDEGEIKTSQGFYVDLGYNIGNFFEITTQVIPFIRYTNYNTAQHTVSDGILEEAGSISKWLIGVSVMPFESVAFKLDYGQRTVKLNDSKTDLINVGVGYMF
ncbi:MAG: porin [Melioribacteraceae bacterium]|nr:hypothetical protein [Melioribacteraceae bacterium]MDD3558540.1 porin [Melioribacteraceae bacterium]